MPKGSRRGRRSRRGEADGRYPSVSYEDQNADEIPGSCYYTPPRAMIAAGTSQREGSSESALQINAFNNIFLEGIDKLLESNESKSRGLGPVRNRIFSLTGQM